MSTINNIYYYCAFIKSNYLMAKLQSIVSKSAYQLGKFLYTVTDSEEVQPVLLSCIYSQALENLNTPTWQSVQ